MNYSMINSSNTITILKKQAVLYRFTKIDIFSQKLLELVDQFHFYNCYSLETF
jgi:hypothetical protein